MYRLVLHVDALPASNPGSRHVHWRVLQREREQWAFLLRGAMERQRKPKHPLTRAGAWFRRRSSREPDSDNLQSSFKQIRDLLQVPSRSNPAGLGIILSDAPGTLVETAYDWERAPPKKGGISILVWEVKG